ncbi:MAG: HTTM domain-containing protein [Bryobacteraceae bacterium]
MSIHSVVKAWNRFFFEPQSPTPIALFRILYGILTIANLLFLYPDWLNWFGPHAWVTIATMHNLEPGTRLNLFMLIPQTDLSVMALFWVFLLFAISLALGLFTRFSTIVVFLCLTSIHQRNIYILHAGDTLMRVTGFFLMFAPAGAAFSIDRLIRVRRGKEEPVIRPRSPWAQRMIQFELALVYLTGFGWKSLGSDWVDGTALYYVFHVDQLRRFPLPSWFYDLAVLKLCGWFTLAFEFAFGILVWFKETRYAMLALGAVFHLSIEYMLNIQLFEWMMLATYVIFIDPDDLDRAWKWIATIVRDRRVVHKR